MKFKKSMVCRNVNDFVLNTELAHTHVPKSGDVALFEVVNIGKHTRIQSDQVRNKMIFTGDVVMLAFGNRYATAQLHGLVPDSPQEEYHILGQGGVCGVVNSFHKKFALKGPTTLKMIGYAVDKDDKVINTKYHNTPIIPSEARSASERKILLSIGGAMDSGKTTTAGYLSRGLAKAGNKVSFIKLTGTAYSKDVDFVKDCGADTGYDFSYFGYPSTYMDTKEELLLLFDNLVAEADKSQPDYIVVEIADGILQRETNFLLQSSLMDKIDGVVYSDSTSTGILAGLESLKKMNINPFGVCGAFVASPLMVQEVKDRSDINIFDLTELSSGIIEHYVAPHRREKKESIRVNSTMVKVAV